MVQYLLFISRRDNNQPSSSHPKLVINNADCSTAKSLFIYVQAKAGLYN